MAEQDKAEVRESSAKRSKGVKQEFKMAEVKPHPIPGSTEFIPSETPKNMIEDRKKEGAKFGGAEGEKQAAEEVEHAKVDDSNIIK